MNYAYVTWEQILAMDNTRMLKFLYACAVWKASIMVRIKSYVQTEDPTLPDGLVEFRNTARTHGVSVVLARRYLSIIPVEDDPNLLEDLRFFSPATYVIFRDKLQKEKNDYGFNESTVDLEPYKPRYLEKFKNGGCSEPWNGLHRGALKSAGDLADISMPGGSSVPDSWKWNYVLAAKKVVLNHARYFNNPVHTPPATHAADMIGREVVDFFFVNKDGSALPGTNSFPWSSKLAGTCIKQGQWIMKDGRTIPLSPHLLFYTDAQDVVEDRLMEMLISLGVVQ